MALAAALVLIGAAFAMVYGVRLCVARPSAARTFVKTLAVVPLAVAAPALGAPAAVALGLGLGAAGDFFLSRPGERSFLAGMAAFAAGHLAYAIAFVAAGAGRPDALPLSLLLALGLSTEIWLTPHAGGLRWPIRGYVLVSLVMAAAALGLPPGAATVGAALFVLSDLILAVDLFRFGPARANLWRARALWLSYWSGQALILVGMAGAL